MCDQAMPYAVGTLVWFKAADRIWWPAKIVDPEETPEEFQSYMYTKKNLLGVVFFEREKYYDVIINMNKVCLYSCPDKIEFLKKGYVLYLRQLKSGDKRTFDMELFITDVLTFEKEIGGDLNIFDQFKEEEYNVQEIKDKIKELFPSTKGKKSLSKTPRSKLDKSTSKTPNSKLESSSKTPKMSKSLISSSMKSANKTVSPRNHRHIPSTVDSTKFVCSMIKGCNFKTNNYASLKRHMNDHNKNKEKNDSIKSTIITTEDKTASNKGSDNKALLSTSSKKRKNVKVKRSDTKKIKLQDELLKDWSDGEDQDEVLGTELNATTSIVKEITENKIYDFDDDSNESVGNVSDIQKNKLCGSFHDRLTSKSEEVKICATEKQSHNLENNTDDQIESTTDICAIENVIKDDDGTKEQSYSLENNTDDQIEDTTQICAIKNDFDDDDSSKKPSCNLENNIDDQMESATFLLETESNLDQINNLEESLNCIDININKSFNNLNVVDKSLKLMEIYNDTIEMENAVENMTRETITENTSSISDDINSLEVQQQSSNNDEPSITSCVSRGGDKESGSYNSDINIELMSDKVETQPTKDDRYECLIDRLPMPEWVKESSWEKLPNNGLKEARRYTTIDKHAKVFLGLPPMSPSPPLTMYADDVNKSCEIAEYYMVRAPIKQRKHTTEELLAMPEVQIMRDAMKINPGSVKFKIIDGKLLRP